MQTPCRYIVRQSRSLCRDYVSQDCAVILFWREAFLSLCLPLNHLFTLAITLLSLHLHTQTLSKHTSNMSTTTAVEEEGVVLKHEDDVSFRMIYQPMYTTYTDLSNLNTFSPLGLLHYSLQNRPSRMILLSYQRIISNLTRINVSTHPRQRLLQMKSSKVNSMGG